MIRDFSDLSAEERLDHLDVIVARDIGQHGFMLVASYAVFVDHPLPLEESRGDMRVVRAEYARRARLDA